MAKKPKTEDEDVQTEEDEDAIEMEYQSGYITARLTIRGVAAYSQSHQHQDEFLQGESPDHYDARTWRSKMNTTLVDGKKVMVIPSMALQFAMIEGAKFSKKKMQGEGKSTWTRRFQSGVSVVGPAVIYDADGEPVWADNVTCVPLSMNSDGKRGGSTRVIRRLPQIAPGWSAMFEVWILDAMITQAIFAEMVSSTGRFVGVGQFRPERGGNNGRFVIEALVWDDTAREKVSARRGLF